MKNNLIRILSFQLVLFIILIGIITYRDYSYCKNPLPLFFYDESIPLTPIPEEERQRYPFPGLPPTLPSDSSQAIKSNPAFLEWMNRCNSPTAWSRETQKQEKKIAKIERSFFCNNTPREAAIIKTPYHIEKDTYGAERGVGYVTVSGQIKVQTREGLGGNYQSIEFFADENSKNDSLESNLFYEVYRKQNVYGSFNIGTIVDGRIKTTAELNASTEEKILSTIRSGETIALTFYIPFGEYDFGVPDHFSEACKIEIAN